MQVRESFVYVHKKAAESFTGPWERLDKNGETVGSFQTRVGTVKGTWKVEVSDDPRAGANDPAARPVDITSKCDFSLCPNPMVGTAYDGIIVLAALGVGFIRLSATITEGTDPIDVWGCLK
jgi:hypothetical protein